ncbi:MAG: NAD(P)/FAD-dependent oxidoreductase [Peptococcaceae bacterium]|nr:NAD(P)/FAD-dependent oxidoreductase [Peptococcaceae bacterium]
MVRASLNRFEIIIAGGGPAGSLLAYYAAQRGYEVLLVDRARFPRTKPCGGGITVKAAGLIPFAWQDIVEDVTLVSTLVNQRVCRLQWPQPVCYMITRDKFDHLMLDNARRAGAIIKEGCGVMEVRRDSAGVTVRLENGTLYEGEILVGADGAHSRVAPLLNKGKRQGFAAVAEVAAPADRLEAVRNSLIVDFKVIPYGYGWVFPKRDHLNVGVCTMNPTVKPLGSYLQSLLRKQNLAPGWVRRKYGFPLPHHAGVNRVFGEGRIILLGDAAGLNDPFTGEGIYTALYSATLTAEVLQDRYRRWNDITAAYQKRIMELVVPEWKKAYLVARLFYATPLGASFLEKRPYLAQELWDVLYSGRYCDIKKVLGRNWWRLFYRGS